ncbi:uncharacterized protein PgNI_02267 [Pyricularia grisea]|uniref:Uncharacterized protein n=1 Tax=Pyricularia grisea TaxID=148305 RepID=A0A6P8BGU8_PYRGI|nr:uncharacterized protein PgNI_02267 [Pyricularia grisea]TLD15844.1 hypothetical protein PgNI_02267 [Pyricularia grisea]
MRRSRIGAMTSSRQLEENLLQMAAQIQTTRTRTLATRQRRILPATASLNRIHPLRLQNARLDPLQRMTRQTKTRRATRKRMRMSLKRRAKPVTTMEARPNLARSARRPTANRTEGTRSSRRARVLVGKSNRLKMKQRMSTKMMKTVMRNRTKRWLKPTRKSRLKRGRPMGSRRATRMTRRKRVSKKTKKKKTSLAARETPKTAPARETR